MILVFFRSIQVDELADEDLGPTSFLLGDIYIDEEVEDELPSHLINELGLNVGGHLYRKEQTLEFYRINVYNKFENPQDPVHFELHDYYFRLDWSSGRPKRVNLNQLSKIPPEDDFKFGNKNLRELLKGGHPHDDINYEIIYETDDLKLVILNPLDSFYTKDGKPYSNKFSLVIQYSPKRGRFKDKLITEEFGGRDVAEEQMRCDHLMFGYPLKVDQQNPANFEVFLMEVFRPPTNYPCIRIRLGYFTFADQKAAEWTRQITWDNLLSCHTWDSDEMHTEARGVYYDKRSKAFYVFIKRFYLRYTMDLVKEGFYLADYEMSQDHLTKERYFGDQAQDIKFESHVKNVKWDLGPRMYVKNLVLTSYFTPGLENFAMWPDDKGKLVFRRMEKEVGDQSYLRFCFRQTFELDERVYCFDELAYRLVHKKTGPVEPRKTNRTSISRIFDTAPFKWKERPIRFIFNYHDNQIVFLSYEFLFIFSYTNFRRNPDDTIYYEHDENHVAMMGTSCLFEPYDCFKSNTRQWPIDLEVRKKIKFGQKTFDSLCLFLQSFLADNTYNKIDHY